jgi:hypothetical protein
MLVCIAGWLRVFEARHDLSRQMLNGRKRVNKVKLCMTNDKVAPMDTAGSVLVGDDLPNTCACNCRRI